MPEHTRQVARWRRLGRLLPREVRERVFDPAFADLTYAWLSSRPGAARRPFGVQVLATYLGCFSIAVPQFFVRRGRLTRLSRVSLWAAGVLATVVVVLANVARSYGSYAP